MRVPGMVLYIGLNQVYFKCHQAVIFLSWTLNPVLAHALLRSFSARRRSAFQMSKMSRVAPTLKLNTLVATAAAVAVVGLAGCAPQDEVTVDVYDTAATCVAKSGDLVACEKNDKAAREVHAKTAPRYADKKDCEEDWGDGKCEAAPPTTALNQSGSATHAGGGGSTFVYWPYYSGYVSGSNASTGASLAPQPVYRDRHSQLVTSSGAVVSPGSKYSASALAAPSQPAQFAKGTSGTQAAKAAGISKGGFGAAGRAGAVSVGG
jgi:uncharacterized protein YgiB involved in biofilm formation